MGDPKKNRKKYKRPKTSWSIQQLGSELSLMGEYGLRNKKELWRHHAILSKYRIMARGFLARSAEERVKKEKQILNKLYSYGVIPKNSTLDDVLDLSIQDILERRLQTIVFKKGLAKTPSQARQFIVHGHISLGDKKITIPSYIVERDEEATISYTTKNLELIVKQQKRKV